MATNNMNESSTAITHIEAFFETHDTLHVSENAVFKNLNTGQETTGREAIEQMLHYLYRIAFDARAIMNNTIVTNKKAVLEATFTGKHIGDFANIPRPTKTSVFPCVSHTISTRKAWFRRQGFIC